MNRLDVVIAATGLSAGSEHRSYPAPAISDDSAALYQLTDRLFRACSLQDVYDAALDAIASAMDCQRASILLFDEEGVMRFVAWRGLSLEYRRAVDGHSPWKPGDIAPEPIFVIDMEKTNEPEDIKRAIAHEGIRALAFIPLVARGVVVGKFMTYYDDPRAFTRREIELAVTIARQVGFSIERARAEAEREAAESALKEQEECSRVMLEHAPVMIWTSDQKGHCSHLNHLLREFWGLAEDDVAAFDWSSTIHPDDAQAALETITRAVADRVGVRLQGRYRNAQGGYRVLLTDAQPRFSGSGEFLGMIGVNVDITEREEAQAQRELLLAELNHRVKNTLAVVQALAQQSFKASAGDERDAFFGRLNALATANTMLTQTNWTYASLSRIAEDTLAAGRPNGDRLSLSGPTIPLDPRAALAVTLALHELLTNAVKYGALSNELGAVDVTWVLLDSVEPRFRLVWRESGGPLVAPPSKTGFGSRLIRRLLAKDLCGHVELDFRPEGVVCTIEGKVSADDRAFAA
ncbi:sensor histidine kinase [Alsobacter sp. SYSU BS001988]